MCARISIYTPSEYEEVMGSEMLNDLLGSYSVLAKALSSRNRGLIKRFAELNDKPSVGGDDVGS